MIVYSFCNLTLMEYLVYTVSTFVFAFSYLFVLNILVQNLVRA